MATQDQLELAFNVAEETMGSSVYKPLTVVWEEDLQVLAYRLARVAGLLHDNQALVEFRDAIVETVKRRYMAKGYETKEE